MTAKESIHAVLSQYLNSLQVRDWSAFEACLQEGFTYYTDNCIVQDRASFLSFMKRNDWSGEECKIYDVEIIVSDAADLAVAIYKVDFKGIEAGQSLAFSATETTVFGCKNDEWKILHSHTSNKM